ncbi:13479_t:CDS:1, partial [Funneliformis mosseae]
LSIATYKPSTNNINIQILSTIVIAFDYQFAYELSFLPEVIVPFSNNILYARATLRRYCKSTSLQNIQ